jgi:hypothetical protein
MASEHQPCPICKTLEATFKTPNPIDREHVTCPQCGEFLISGPAIATLSHKPLEARQAALEVAAKGRASPGALPYIHT